MDTEQTEFKIAHLSTTEWGMVLILARDAVNRAFEDAKAKQQIKDKSQMATLIYTDDPSTTGALYMMEDLEDMVGVSQIVDVAIIPGERFPADAFEGVRKDPDMPRIAAMFFYSEGTKCPRCRKIYKHVEASGICTRCDRVVKELDAAKAAL